MATRWPRIAGPANRIGPPRATDPGRGRAGRLPRRPGGRGAGARHPAPTRRPPPTRLLAAVFPDGLPYPFETLLDRLRARVGAENVATALIPLGRSLQRFAAAPDYFTSPRIVVAVTGDAAAGPGDARVADRLFLGYQPAADVIEVIAYDEATGAFDFDEVVGYSGGAAPTPAEPRVCFACHQSRTPIFSRPLWSESNANPEVARRLAPLGDSFHGAPVRRTVDDLEAFDAATDRAAAIPLANWLWSEACPDAACRAALLAGALRVGLTGVADDAGPPAFATEAAARWPDGVAAISQDLPNRDPLLESDGTDNPQSTGLLDPETPRAPLPLWQPAPGSFATAAAAIAAQLSPGDLAWIDARLRRMPAATATVSLACDTHGAALPDGRSETRFACGGDGRAPRRLLQLRSPRPPHPRARRRPTAGRPRPRSRRRRPRDPRPRRRRPPHRGAADRPRGQPSRSPTTSARSSARSRAPETPRSLPGRSGARRSST